jgi:hypothetical protein
VLSSCSTISLTFIYLAQGLATFLKDEDLQAYNLGFSDCLYQSSAFKNDRGFATIEQNN